MKGIWRNGTKLNEEQQGKDERIGGDTNRNKKDKRNALRALIGTAALVGSKYWMKPIVSSVILPTHAQTTTSEEILEPEQPPLQVRDVVPPDNTPPLGENVGVDAQEQTRVQYSLLPHISDQESPASELSISIVTLPLEGSLTLVGTVDFLYELSPQSFAESDQFDYQVVDPQGAKSPVYTVDIINFPVVPQ